MRTYRGDPAIQQAAQRADPKNTLIYLHAAPAKTSAGDMVLADGTDWNPGSGAGLYQRNEANTAWICIDDQSAWTAYTPTITAGTGAFTTVSATGRYKQIGKTVFVSMSITITNVGTAGTSVNATLPVSAKVRSSVCSGRENAVSGAFFTGYIDGTLANVAIQKYDGTFIGANGYVLDVAFTYEAA